jgi:hypothetical protein
MMRVIATAYVLISIRRKYQLALNPVMRATPRVVPAFAGIAPPPGSLRARSAVQMSFAGRNTPLSEDRKDTIERLKMRERVRGVFYSKRRAPIGKLIRRDGRVA